MILLLGSKDDTFTTSVAEWLSKFQHEYMLFIGNENVKIVSCNNDNIIIDYYGRQVSLLDVKSVLSRRSGFSVLSFIESDCFSDLPIEVKDIQQKYVSREISKIVDFIHLFLKKHSSVVIGGFKGNDVNKLSVINYAIELGIKVPYYSVLSTKNDLFNFFNYAKNRNDNIISKPTAEGIYEFSGNYGYYSYVERVKESDFNDMPDRFFPSFFQQEIKKKYDIRTFYLAGSFYSMAILSQSNINTETDFRKPTSTKSINRKIPYKLPDMVEKKIELLMNVVNLNTASIDIVLDTNGDYYFLEINPVGQILMTSMPCNYYLDKLVAKTLINI